MLGRSNEQEESSISPAYPRRAVVVPQPAEPRRRVELTTRIAQGTHPALIAVLALGGVVLVWGALKMAPK